VKKNVKRGGTKGFARLTFKEASHLEQALRYGVPGELPSDGKNKDTADKDYYSIHTLKDKKIYVKYNCKAKIESEAESRIAFLRYEKATSDLTVMELKEYFEDVLDKSTQSGGTEWLERLARGKAAAPAPAVVAAPRGATPSQPASAGRHQAGNATRPPMPTTGWESQVPQPAYPAAGYRQSPSRPPLPEAWDDGGAAARHHAAQAHAAWNFMNMAYYSAMSQAPAEVGKGHSNKGYGKGQGKGKKGGQNPQPAYPGMAGLPGMPGMPGMMPAVPPVPGYFPPPAGYPPPMHYTSGPYPPMAGMYPPAAYPPAPVPGGAFQNMYPPGPLPGPGPAGGFARGEDRRYGHGPTAKAQVPPKGPPAAKGKKGGKGTGKGGKGPKGGLGARKQAPAAGEPGADVAKTAPTQPPAQSRGAEGPAPQSKSGRLKGPSNPPPKAVPVAVAGEAPANVAAAPAKEPPAKPKQGKKKKAAGKAAPAAIAGAPEAAPVLPLKVSAPSASATAPADSAPSPGGTVGPKKIQPQVPAEVATRPRTIKPQKPGPQTPLKPVAPVSPVHSPPIENGPTSPTPAGDDKRKKRGGGKSKKKATDVPASDAAASAEPVAKVESSAT